MSTAAGWSSGDEETVLRRVWVGLTLCLYLAACGGGGGTTGGGNNNGGGGGGGGGGATTADLGGVALAADGALAAGQAPVASATVQVFGLPTAAVLSTSSTDSTGAYQFSTTLGNAIPLNRTLRVVAQTGTRIVSGFVNSSGTSLTKHLDDVTHVAALAMLATGQTSLTDGQILLFEQAARARLEAALVADPTARFALVRIRLPRRRLAAQVRARCRRGLGGQRGAAGRSIVSSPTQFVVQAARCKSVWPPPTPTC